MSNDITINISNKDAGDEYIVIFQKPKNVNEIYKTLFPVAWQVIPLGNEGSQSITYPVQLQLTVKESEQFYNAKSRGTIRNVGIGQVWKFYNRGDFDELDQLNEPTVDGVVVVRNEAAQKIDVGLAKNGKPLVVKRQVGESDQAEFQLTPTLYFAYVNDLQEGELIKSEISASKTYALDLTNLKSVDIDLSMKDEGTGQKQWTVSHRVAAS